MTHAFRTVCLAIILSAAAPASAGTQVLGAELGVSTPESVKASLSGGATVENTGTNRYSGGPMLRADGASFDIEGLNSVLYVFDEQNRLAGVVMAMSKYRFESVLDHLQKKYETTTVQRAIVGTQFARLKTDDGSIELNSPHMSYEMSVLYARTELTKKVEAGDKPVAAARKRQEAAQF